MTLQSNGQISIGNVSTEFSLSHPTSMSSFYGEGGAPSSGQISLSTMYGRSNWTVTVSTSGSDRTSSEVLTFTSTQSGTVWTWNTSNQSGTASFAASIASGGSGAVETFTLSSTKSGSVYLNGSVTVNVTATYGGQTFTDSVTMTVGTQ